MLFTEKIKQLQEEKQMLQHQFVADLEIDMPMYSKMKITVQTTSRKRRKNE
ncbi:MAG: hypothetical protein LBE13_09485 [Bacteroidales bacterium]|jgi:hypothetical protein|nr:hypothetical protein [Bacteroidales bacterium]